MKLKAVLVLLLCATTVQAHPGPRKNDPLEAAIQRLRPYEERLAYTAPADMLPEPFSAMFREIWQLATFAANVCPDAKLRRELTLLAQDAREAARFGDLATPQVRFNLPGDERGTRASTNYQSRQLVLLALEPAERAAKRLDKIIGHFPLFLDPAIYGDRP
jgi:hypothetical protein